MNLLFPTTRKTAKQRQLEEEDAKWAKLGYRPKTDWLGRRDGYEKPTEARRAFEAAVNAATDYMVGMRKDYDFERREPGMTPGETYVSNPMALGFGLLAMATPAGPASSAAPRAGFARKAGEYFRHPTETAKRAGTAVGDGVAAAGRWFGDKVGAPVKSVVGHSFGATVGGPATFWDRVVTLGGKHPIVGRVAGWGIPALIAGTAIRNWWRSGDDAANTKMLKAQDEDRAKKQAEYMQALTNNAAMAEAVSDAQNLRAKVVELDHVMRTEAQLAFNRARISGADDKRAGEVANAALAQAVTNNIPTLARLRDSEAFDQLSDEQLTLEIGNAAGDMSPTGQRDYINSRWMAPDRGPFGSVFGPGLGYIDRFTGATNTVPSRYRASAMMQEGGPR